MFSKSHQPNYCFLNFLPNLIEINDLKQVILKIQIKVCFWSHQIPEDITQKNQKPH